MRWCWDWYCDMIILIVLRDYYDPSDDGILLLILIMSIMISWLWYRDCDMNGGGYGCMELIWDLMILLGPGWFCRPDLVTSAVMLVSRRRSSYSRPGIGAAGSFGLWVAWCDIKSAGDRYGWEFRVVWCDGGGLTEMHSYHVYCCSVLSYSTSRLTLCIREHLWWTNYWGADWQVLMWLDGSWTGCEAWTWQT